MRLQPSDQPPGVSEVLQSGARLFKDSLPRCLPLALLAVVVGQLPSAYDALRGEAATLASPKDAAWWAIVVASGLVNLWLWNLLMLVQRAFVRGDATAPRAFAVEALRRLLPVLGLLACSLALIGLGLVLLECRAVGGCASQQGLVSVVSALVGCLFMPFVTALGQAHHAALEQSLALSRLPPGALPGAPGAAAR